MACSLPMGSRPPIDGVKNAVNIAITSSSPEIPKYFELKGTMTPASRVSWVLSEEMSGWSNRREVPKVRWAP